MDNQELLKIIEKNRIPAKKATLAGGVVDKTPEGNE